MELCVTFWLSNKSAEMAEMIDKLQNLTKLYRIVLK